MNIKPIIRLKYYGVKERKPGWEFVFHRRQNLQANIQQKMDASEHKWSKNLHGLQSTFPTTETMEEALWSRT